MTVGGIVFLSCVTVAAFLFLLLRIMSFKRLLRWAIPIDVAFSIIALFAFGGTWTGTAVAITSGLILAIFLTVCRSVSKRSPERFDYRRVIRHKKRNLLNWATRSEK